MISLCIVWIRSHPRIARLHSAQVPLNRTWAAPRASATAPPPGRVHLALPRNDLNLWLGLRGDIDAVFACVERIVNERTAIENPISFLPQPS